VRFTCTSWSWPLLPFEDVIRVMRVLGFSAIDVGAFAGFVHFEPVDLARTPRRAAAQLTNIGRRHDVGFTDLFVTFGPALSINAVNAPEQQVRDANAEIFRGIVEFCAEAAIPGITLCPGIEHPGSTRAACLDLATQELGRLTELGRGARLRVSFEPHLESIAESPEEALRVVTAVDGLTLTLDYSHFIAQGYAPEAVHPLLPYAGHVHLRQAKAGTLQARGDDGAIDFDAVLNRLEEHGYARWVAFEYEWNEWQGNNRVDVLSETVALKRRLGRFDAVSIPTAR
jgi:sugar phosphate isomerase/epimerase